MILHTEIDNKSLLKKIRRREIWIGGNLELKIYGTLSCKSGKRMKKVNRAFFANEQEAIHAGFRPCGHCMRKEYLRFILKQAK